MVWPHRNRSRNRFRLRGRWRRALPEKSTLPPGPLCARRCVSGFQSPQVNRSLSLPEKRPLRPSGSGPPVDHSALRRSNRRCASHFAQNFQNGGPFGRFLLSPAREKGNFNFSCHISSPTHVNPVYLLPASPQQKKAPPNILERCLERKCHPSTPKFYLPDLIRVQPGSQPNIRAV